jgi:hypothetical protein
MSERTFAFYSDPSHGWLQVPKALIKELGIANEISGYSYERGLYVYLEEDCDFSVFTNAVPEKIAIHADHYENESRVRSYTPYEPECITR